MRRRVDEPRRETRGVLEQIADGHVLAIGAAPFVEEFGDRIVEPHARRAHELHQDGRRGDDFRERREIEGGVELRRRRPGIEGQRAERIAPERAGGRADLETRRGKDPAGNRALDDEPRGENRVRRARPARLTGPPGTFTQCPAVLSAAPRHPRRWRRGQSCARGGAVSAPARGTDRISASRSPP